MAFERHATRKRYTPPRRIATVCGRPAWEAKLEKKDEEVPLRPKSEEENPV